ncbi:60S ribosomal protein eL33 [Cenococcum geophilum 1.58]|uniref:60S ribosomal protein eL33 n=1 Tax=Cenococcum geophilum 1.58 TaxID=794803 RepID=UPI00358FEBBF|nr:hypothetical protein K441DRAFT_655116 [Cenococcum geophilum 1.58]
MECARQFTGWLPAKPLPHTAYTGTRVLRVRVARLVWGKHLSYQRGKRNTTPGTSLIKIEGVDDTKAATFYTGKKVAFVYRAQKEVRGSKIRVIWGKFRHNLPPKSFGASVRVMLYPSSI